MTKAKLCKELTKVLKAKAKELKSDFNDVPTWVIEASAEFFVDKVNLKVTTKEETIKLAEQFLAGDGDTEQAIQAIINHPEDNDLIDNVDGVSVWEKVEYSFTCEQFLEQINYKPADWK